MTIDEVLAFLVEYKYLILAGFLGNGLIDRWLTSLPDSEFATLARKMLNLFEHQFRECLLELSNPRNATGLQKIRNEFHLAFMGLPLEEVAIGPVGRAGLQRRPTQGPQPAIITARNMLDKSVRGAVAQPRQARQAALEPMRELLKKNNSLYQFLKEKLHNLKEISKEYNVSLIKAQSKLQVDLLRTRQQINRSGAKTPVQSSSEETTEPENSSEEEAGPNNTFVDHNNKKRRLSRTGNSRRKLTRYASGQYGDMRFQQAFFQSQQQTPPDHKNRCLSRRVKTFP